MRGAHGDGSGTIGRQSSDEHGLSRIPSFRLAKYDQLQERASAPKKKVGAVTETSSRQDCDMLLLVDLCRVGVDVPGYPYQPVTTTDPSLPTHAVAGWVRFVPPRLDPWANNKR